MEIRGLEETDHPHEREICALAETGHLPGMEIHGLEESAHPREKEICALAESARLPGMGICGLVETAGTPGMGICARVATARTPAATDGQPGTAQTPEAETYGPRESGADEMWEETETLEAETFRVQGEEIDTQEAEIFRAQEGGTFPLQAEETSCVAAEMPLTLVEAAT
jgi:hypothetical protein